mmetsp:Transcript_17435/g.42322  ORF Transcript_17435/g.42322 Transcript_17435/m.42322 type:complete len:153 (-) Transcript_17435:539-997(-)
MSGFFGKEKFDPQLIIAQMIVMQTLHYLCLGFAFFLMDGAMGVPITLDQFFTSNVFASGLTNNLALGSVFANLLAVAGNVWFLYIVVERAKKCLDFAATMYGFHILFCWYYGGMPTHWQWWTTTIASAVVTILVGEYVCARREMREITIVRR